MARLYGPGPGTPPALIATSDLAGLSANDVEDRPVGELFGALSEETSGLIRYLDIEVRGADKHVLVPIGHARFDREAIPPRVRLRAATRDDLVSIPEFVTDGTSFDADYQDRLLTAHGRLFHGSRYYAHPAYDHPSLQLGESRVVRGETRGSPERPPLRSLSEVAGFSMARRGPNLLDWSVRDRSDESVGTVADLLVEPSSRLARYVVIDLDDPGRQTMLPVGYMDVDSRRKTVRLPALTAEDVRLLPPYEPPVTRGAENRLHAALEGRLTGDRYFDRVDFRGDAQP
ncbi:MAG: PRC-barrel domain-containing protein [Gemmatimonadota bacterium]